MELLDDVKIVERKKPIFSILAIVMIVMFISMMYYVGNTLDENNHVENEMVKGVFSLSLLILGILCSITSFVRKEKPLILRLIPAAVFLCLVVAIAVAIITDF